MVEEFPSELALWVEKPLSDERYAVSILGGGYAHAYDRATMYTKMDSFVALQAFL